MCRCTTTDVLFTTIPAILVCACFVFSLDAIVGKSRFALAVAGGNDIAASIAMIAAQEIL